MMPTNTNPHASAPRKRTGCHHWASRRIGEPRRGTIAILAAILMIPLLGVVAFAVDYAYLLKKRTELQRTADAAVLAAVRDLLPDPTGYQDYDKVRATVRTYVAANVEEDGFTVLDSDIEIGRYDPALIYSNISILDTGIADTVRVKLRYDAAANSSVSLYFAKALGIDNAGVTATSTAVLQKATQLYPGADVLPFAIHEDLWGSRSAGDEWSIYGDGRVEDEYGTTIPGNWGTVDIGDRNNSTEDINDQILTGLRQEDLDALYNDQRIPTNTHIDSTNPWLSQADTGLSSGIKHSVQQVHGLTRIVPIYDYVSGAGDNTDFRVVRWGVVTVVNSEWKGTNNTYVTIKKSYTYNNETLRPQSDLSNATNVIDGAYTKPALVQ